MIFRYLETGLSDATDGAWQLFQAVNSPFVGNSCQPVWAPAPLLKGAERTAPQLGWPRSTDSRCPPCVPETRRILSGEQSVDLRAKALARQQVIGPLMPGVLSAA
jgi:hypothetical protein